MGGIRRKQQIRKEEKEVGGMHVYYLPGWFSELVECWNG